MEHSFNNEATVETTTESTGFPFGKYALIGAAALAVTAVVYGTYKAMKSGNAEATNEEAADVEVEPKTESAE